MKIKSVIAATAIMVSVLWAAQGEYAGIRSSDYGFDYTLPTVDSISNIIQNIGNKLDATASAVWLVGTIEYGTGVCRLEFPQPEGIVNTGNITFDDSDRHEKYMAKFDDMGAKVFLQVEAGMANMNTLIDAVVKQYGHHSSFAGFGIDVEWYPSWGETNCSDGGERTPITKTQIETFDSRLKNALDKNGQRNSNRRLFVKHWEPDYLGGDEYSYNQGVSDVIYISDSQGEGAALVDEFEWWAGIFSNNEVGFQIGYPDDKNIWWGAMNDPFKQITDAIKSKIRNQKVHIYWVDFTIRDNKFKDLWNTPDGKFDVTVSGGSGTGRYKPGDEVKITANGGNEFISWTATGVTLTNPNSATTTFKMPNNEVSVIANFKGTAQCNDLVFWDPWFAQAEHGTSDDNGFDTENGIIAFNMQTQPEDDAAKFYPWADVATYFSEGDFTNVSNIEITYSANEDIKFVLTDTKGLSDEGEGYTYVLKSTNGAQESRNLTPSQFYRVDENYELTIQMTNSEKQYIEGVSFGVGGDANAQGQITKLVINGLKVDCNTPITYKPANKSIAVSKQFATLSAGTLNFSIPTEKTAFVQIVDLRGRLILAKEISLNNGTAGLKLPKSLSKNQMILVNIYGKNGSNFSQKMLVK